MKAPRRFRTLGWKRNDDNTVTVTVVLAPWYAAWLRLRAFVSVLTHVRVHVHFNPRGQS